MKRSYQTILSILLLSMGGCSCSDSPAPAGCSTAAECPAGEMCVGRRCAAPDSGVRDSAAPDLGPARTLLSIRIVPPGPTMLSRNGAMVSVDLDVEATWSDMTSSILPTATWSVDSTRLGDINVGSGVFTATGELAGTVIATAAAMGMTAATTVTVTIEHTILVGTTPVDAPSLFAGTRVDDPMRRSNVVYPLAGALMPQNVFPADIQWDQGAMGDIYKVALTGPGVTVIAYVEHDGTFHWPVSRVAWRALAEAMPEADIVVTVERYEAATSVVLVGAPVAFQFANATIRGSVYYWDLSAGKTLRIRGDGTGREDFMPFPPSKPGTPTNHCVACHSISPDGRRMAAQLWGGSEFSATFDLTADLSVDPAPTLMSPNVERFEWSTFNPDGSRLVVNRLNLLRLLDPNTGARLPTSGTPLPTAGAAQPAWSPDGAWLTYISNTNGGWGVDFTRGDVTVVSAGPGDTFGAPMTIFAGAPLVAAHPSWSSDSTWIAFQHGEHSRSRQHLGGTSYANRAANVRLVSRDGITFYDLAALNGANGDSFHPTFSPFDEGGYYWLAFFSRRDYGNAQVGTAGTARRQLWVAAIDSTPAPGVDPSRVPYWLPQQQVDRHNMAAYWTKEPCFADGRTCATSGECCSGFCRDQGMGLVCVPPTRVTCSLEGEPCVVDSDCCPGAGSCGPASLCTTLI